MKSSKLTFICFAVATGACGSPSATVPPMDNGNGGGAGQPGSGPSGNAGSEAASGSSGASSSSSGASGTGSADDAASGASGSGDSGIVFDGGVNMLPADYTGTPFVPNVIPGFIYTADYDKGGPGLAYCHSATATTPMTCANGI